ncbi:MAG: M23 family metallopeptidase [Flavobacteriaceae bacterium]|jgi:murein DD-endopeptidase MepM/ murein hydrolase activator NlpD|nr:M23 family metallopeptidase [Flavobacteriaceae bacterium]
MKKILFTTLLLSNLLFAQNYSEDFAQPLSIPVSLSANFAELRANHFHAGLDIRTQQRTGLKIFATQDGYISRINISPYGYGKAIYITHPNGYTTVYGHLSELIAGVEKTRKEQYAKKSYTVDFYLQPDEIPVKQGDIIALTGNTGGSGGPHLHFEVRDTKTEEILNPFLFGYELSDHVAPQVSGVWIYPLDGGKVNQSTNKVLAASSGNYLVSGSIGFGVKAYDKQDGSNNLNGIYSIKTYVNSELISTFQADRCSFDESRMINASIDYPEQISKNSWIYRTWILAGNTLPMYKQNVNRGILKVKPDSVYNVRIEVGDFSGNITARMFTLKGEASGGYDSSDNLSNPAWVKYDTPFSFSKDEISLKFDKNSFYEDFDFSFKKISSKKYQIGSSSVPVQKRFELTFSPDTLDAEKKYNFVIMRESNFGKYKKEYLKTEYKNGKYTAYPRDFGNFSLVLDDVKPTISCPALAKSKKVQKRLGFIIKDSDSGIKTFDVFIDGKWILAEYEYKNNTLFIPDLAKEGIEQGQHQLEVTVTDEANNTQKYADNFEKL